MMGHGTSLDMSSSTKGAAVARAPRPEAGFARFEPEPVCPAIALLSRDSGRRRSARACEATAVPSYCAGVIHDTWTLLRLRARVWPAFTAVVLVRVRCVWPWPWKDEVAFPQLRLRKQRLAHG